MPVGLVRTPAQRRTHSIATTVAMVYVTAGALWVAGTDIALIHLFARDSRQLVYLEMAKAWVFIAASGGFLYWVVHRAVIRLARSEATVRAVLDSIADGVFLVGPTQGITSANPAAVHILRAAGDHELIGLGPEEFSRRFRLTLPDGRRVQPERFVSQRALRGEHPPAYKVRLFPPDQQLRREEVVLMCTAAPVRTDPHGPVDLAVSVMHDITELENLERTRDQFFSAAAHALKTPVAIIKAHVHLAAARRTSQARATEVIERQCGKIDRLTDNIIALARMRSGSLRLCPAPTVWADVVEEVVAEMRSASADRELVAQVDARPTVFADRDRLAQVTRNMIEVAFRRSRPRTEVRVDLAERGAHATLRVTYDALPVTDRRSADDGCGFAGLGLEAHVVEGLVHASGGEFVITRADEPPALTTELVVLPVLEEGARG